MPGFPERTVSGGGGRRWGRGSLEWPREIFSHRGNPGNGDPLVPRVSTSEPHKCHGCVVAPVSSSLWFRISSWSLGDPPKRHLFPCLPLHPKRLRNPGGASWALEKTTELRNLISHHLAWPSSPRPCPRQALFHQMSRAPGQESEHRAQLCCEAQDKPLASQTPCPPPYPVTREVGHCFV